MGTLIMARSIALSITLIALTLALPAQAEWYVRAGVGAVVPHNLTNNEGSGSFFRFSAVGTKFTDIALSPGVAVDAKVGYFFQRTPWLGLEADVSLSRPKVKDQTFSGQSPFFFARGTITEGHARVIAPALNVILRYPGERLQPYIGGGPVVAFLKVFDDGGTSSEIGYNALAGIRWLVTRNIALFAEAKYLRAAYISEDVLSPGLGIKGDYAASHIFVGTSFHF